jgi:hypothetical protein
LEIAKTLNTRPAPPESCGKENLWVRRGRYFIAAPVACGREPGFGSFVDHGVRRRIDVETDHVA